MSSLLHCGKLEQGRKERKEKGESAFLLLLLSYVRGCTACTLNMPRRRYTTHTTQLHGKVRVERERERERPPTGLPRCIIYGVVVGLLLPFAFPVSESRYDKKLEFPKRLPAHTVTHSRTVLLPPIFLDKKLCSLSFPLPLLDT